MSQMHSYGCQHQAPASPGHTCSRLFKVLLESPVPCSCSGGGGHELGGVRILGNAGVGAAGKEPLDNELGQDDWAKPGSTVVVLMSGGRNGIGLRRVSCSPLWNQALWGGSTEWAPLLVRGLGTHAHPEPISGDGQVQDVQTGDVKGSVRLMGHRCPTRRRQTGMVGMRLAGKGGARKGPGTLDIREQTPGCFLVHRALRIAGMASVLRLHPCLVWFPIESLPGIAS